jgi:hypothetical protein
LAPKWTIGKLVELLDGFTRNLLETGLAFHVRALTNNRPVFAVIGGMHLVQATAERVQRTIEELRRLRVEKLAPAQGTGAAAVAKLQRSFQDRCIPCHIGSVYTFEFSQAGFCRETRLTKAAPYANTR